jgi:hypothetical protein
VEPWQADSPRRPYRARSRRPRDDSFAVQQSALRVVACNAMAKVDLRLKETFRAVRVGVEKYGLKVYIGDVQDPNTGTFDGTEIGIDYANDLEMSLFVLVHLFGHTVQWNTVPAYRSFEAKVKPGSPPDLIEEARLYELNASRLGLQLFHDLGISDRDQWLANWCLGDWNYLSTYYRTATLPAWHDCVVHDAPPLTPMAIPAFTPQRFYPRYAF